MLVIDDSAVVRQVIRELIASEPDMTVASAADPLIADAKIERQRPDVVILDLELPVMDGLTWLRRRMQTDPLPVIVCSALSGDAAAGGIRALEEGAVEVVTKPRIGVREFLLESRDALVRAIRAAARARLGRLPRAPSTEPPSDRAVPRAPESRDTAARAACPVASERTDRITKDRRASASEASGRSHSLRLADHVIAIGASTGGPPALAAVLGALSRACPPIVIAQHMQAAFTPAFAARLDAQCALDVREARDGDVAQPGTALVAPGGRHLRLRRNLQAAGYAVEVWDGPAVGGHRPSVDVLFASVARVAGARALGILMTGMGTDGADGLGAMQTAGAATLAQSEESCVVFGMPRAALRSGAADMTASPEDMPSHIERWIEGALSRAGQARSTGS